MLGLHSIPKDDSGFSPRQGPERRSSLSPREFLDSDKLPSAVFLDRIQSAALLGLVLPPPHHLPPSTSRIPAALALADYVFVYEDALIRSLSQLYRGPSRYWLFLASFSPCS